VVLLSNHAIFGKHGNRTRVDDHTPGPIDSSTLEIYLYTTEGDQIKKSAESCMTFNDVAVAMHPFARQIKNVILLGTRKKSHEFTRGSLSRSTLLTRDCVTRRPK